MAASDIPLARQALRVLRRGGTPDNLQSEALARVDRLVGANRPLAEYGYTQQKVYLRGASVGADATATNKAEYARRRTRGGRGGRSLRSVIRSRADRNSRAFLNERGEGELAGVFDDDQIDELINLVGDMGALEILEMQWQSIQAYRRGDSSVGHNHWQNRPDTVERYRRGLQTDEYAVPYFFYRVRK
jgi:hypothetical protein